MRLTLFQKLGALSEQNFALGERPLALYRMAFSLYYLLIIGLPNVYLINQIPDLLYEPRSGLGQLLFYREDWSMLLLGALTFVLLLMLFFGYRTKWVSILTSLSLLSLYAICEDYMHGYGRHLLTPLLPLFMAFTGWGNILSVDAKAQRKQPVQGWPIFFFAVAFAFAFFTSGYPKLKNGWLDPSEQLVLQQVLAHHIIRGESIFLAEQMAKLELPWLWEVLDYLVVFLEVALLLTLPFKRVFQSFAACLILFHLGVLLFLNIPFLSIVILYPLFIDWSVLKKWSPFRIPISGKYFTPKVMVLTILICLPVYLLAASHLELISLSGYGILLALVTPLSIHAFHSQFHPVNLYLALPIWLCYGTIALLMLVKHTRRLLNPSSVHTYS